MENQNMNIPSEYRPLSAWAYVGYNLLFSVPLIGFIFLIIYAFDNTNINRRNYARSFFCMMLISLVITIIVWIFIMMVTGVFMFNEAMYY